MAKILSQPAAAVHVGMSVPRFRKLCQSGLGPPVFNPDGSARPSFVDSVLDAWMEKRDDRPATGTAIEVAS